jgi:hypothetical protein
MSRKLTKELYASLKAKLDETIAAGGKGKKKSKPVKHKKKGGNPAGGGSSRSAKNRNKAPSSTAEANLQRNVSLLRKLGAHRTQADVLKKVCVRVYVSVCV